MAAVTINIPNVGNVVAENAASEETLQKILAAMNKIGGGASGGKKPGESKEEKDLKKVREDETKLIKQGQEATKKAGAEQDKTNKSTAAFGKYLNTAWTGVKDGTGQAVGAVGGFAKTLTLTAVSLASAWATSYESMAKDPIGAAATMLATNIDLIAMTGKAAVDVAAGVGKAIGGLAGPFAGAVNGAIDGLSAAAKAAIDFAAAVLKTANQVFANEFKKSAQMLHDFTKSGASFAGGMTEMRNAAHSSGLMMDQFATIVKNSGESIRAMGMNQADGAMAVAQGMSTLKNQIGKSGSSVRDELLKMGYTYEEQGQIVADYGAQMKASGKDIRNLAPSDLAQGVRDYAKNLKVISDITGQDAKKLMEKARQESMRGALMNKLTADQKDAFKSAHSTMAAMGPEFQNALMQMLSGGTVTDPMIAGNAEAMEMIKKVASDVQNGNKDIVSDTQKAMSEAAEATRRRNEAEGSATDQAVLLGNGISGVTKGFADVNNKLAGFTMAADAAERSAAAAEKQANSQDELSNGYAELTSKMNNFGVEMEQFATNHLQTYAKILEQNAELTMGTMKKAVDLMANGLEALGIKGEKKERSTEEKATAALAMGAQGAVVGAAIGTAVPLIGNAVGAAVGGIGGALYGWFKGNTAQNAEGGLATPGKLNIFGEAGPEAAIPLPDGKTVPATVDFKNVNGLMSEDTVKLMATGFDTSIKNIVDFTSKNNTAQQESFSKVIEELCNKLDSLGDRIENQANGGNTVFGELANHLSDLKDTAIKQLDAHEQMKRTLADSKDNLSGILNNIM